MALQFLQSFSPPSIPHNLSTPQNIRANENQDLISLSTLTLSPGLLAPEIWSYVPSTSTTGSKKKRKLQPATLNLSLLLRPQGTRDGGGGGRGGFNSAAENDSLDASTVHYGLLSKAIRARIEEGGGVDVGDLFSVVEGCVLEFALHQGKRCIVSRLGMEVLLPKLGMFSDEGISIGGSVLFDEHGTVVEGEKKLVVGCEGMRLMCLIGVNAVERTARQPLVVGVRVWFNGQSAEQERRRTEVVIGVEQVLAEVRSVASDLGVDIELTRSEQIIEPTVFETLESLASYTAEELQRRLLSRVIPGGCVQLRMEKPRAVAFADAPAIEVLRRIKSVEELGPVDLVVVKPYVAGR